MNFVVVDGTGIGVGVIFAQAEKALAIKSYFSLDLAAFASINCILITQLKLNSIS